MTDPAPEYVTARRVLLDALTALQAHLDNLILVGAQAVYHHAGGADLNVPLLTTDGDLAINTRDLADVPEIGMVLRAAGFVAGPNPGHWVTSGDVAVDLMVVPHQAGTTRASARAARLHPHETLTARIARGLEPALVDNEHVTIAALEPGDPRAFELRVAGPAALLTAKAIKISERLDQADTRPDRLKQKDALDAFRLLQAIDTPDLVRDFATPARTSTPPRSPPTRSRSTGPTPARREAASRCWPPTPPKATRPSRRRSPPSSSTCSRHCDPNATRKTRYGSCDLRIRQRREANARRALRNVHRLRHGLQQRHLRLLRPNLHRL